VGKGAGTALLHGKVSRAPCPRGTISKHVARPRRHGARQFVHAEVQCQRLCPPYDSELPPATWSGRRVVC